MGAHELGAAPGSYFQKWRTDDDDTQRKNAKDKARRAVPSVLYVELLFEKTEAFKK